MTTASQSDPTLAVPPAIRADDLRLGVGLIVISGGLFAMLNAGVKLLSGRFGPVEIAFFRQAFSLIPVTLLLTRGNGLTALRTRRPFGHLFRGLLGNMGMMATFLGLAWLPLADATALSFASPLFVTALAAPLLKESVGVHRWSAVAVGFGGVIVMTNPGGAWLISGAGAGAGIATLAAFMSGLMMITIRQLGRTELPITIVFYFAAIGCLVFGVALPFAWVTPSPLEWAGLIGVGLIGGLSQLTMTHAYRHAPASALAPFGYVSIVWSTALGYLFWGQLPGPRVLIGGSVVIASGFYIVYREGRRRGQAVPPPLPIA